MPNNPPTAASGGTQPALRGDLRALAEYVAQLNEPAVIQLEGDGLKAGVLVLPAGQSAHSAKKFLDEYRIRPERKEGTAKVTSIDSLIALVNRFKDAHSAIFANDSRQQPSITAVFDYHEPAAGSPRFGRHRAHYAFPLSDEWKAWTGANRKALDQRAFAEFIEDRIADVLAPPANLADYAGELRDLPEAAAGGDFGNRTPDEQLAYLARLLGGKFAGPSTLMELSRGLAIHANEKVANAVVLQTGEVNVHYASEHASAQGEKVKVPNLFLIGIPVFHNGPIYRIPVRLRYRLSGGTITWFYELYRDDKVMDHAFDEACKAVIDGTGLPLYRGQPEA